MRFAKHLTHSWPLVLAVLLMAWTGDNPGDWGAQAPPAGVDEKLNWKPNRGDARPAEYVGAPGCAHCHRAIFEKQNTTDMASAAARPADSHILRQHPTLSAEQGPYTYSIINEGGRVLFSVRDAHGKIEEPVVLIIGAGAVHESYLYEHQGRLYQAPVSYYSTVGKLVVLSPPGRTPATLEAALGAPLTDERVRQCMQCHNTAAGLGDSVDLEHQTLGVHCEACHGPGAQHVAAMRAGKPQDTLIIAPARFNSDQEVAFCGTCHHGVPEVTRGELRGIRTVMSQPYRLIQSRCWNSADARSRCSFCHAAHQRLVRGETASYDSKCLSCHVASAHAPLGEKQTGNACPVGKRDCASCHMPTVKIPGSESAFVDHRIRVVLAGAPYPE